MTPNKSTDGSNGAGGTVRVPADCQRLAGVARTRSVLDGAYPDGGPMLAIAEANISRMLRDLGDPSAEKDGDLAGSG